MWLGDFDHIMLNIIKRHRLRKRSYHIKHQVCLLGNQNLFYQSAEDSGKQKILYIVPLFLFKNLTLCFYIFESFL